MTISETLMLVLLAMDSYNRDSGAGVQLDDSVLGFANVSVVSTKLEGAFADAYASSGFFAVAYTFSPNSPIFAGKTIISFRGTDNPSLVPTDVAGASDILKGWISGMGSSSSQAQLALDFYSSVTGRSITDGPAPDVILTGHSMGGGLAEIVSLLTGTKGVGFDYMPTAVAAGVIGAGLGISSLQKAAFSGCSVQSEILEWARNGSIQAVSSAVLGVIPRSIVNLVAQYAFGLDLNIVPESEYLSRVAKETAQLEIGFQKTPLESYSGYTSLGDRMMKLHMNELFVVLQFAADARENDPNRYAQWEAVAAPLWHAFFDAAIAQAAGAKPKDSSGAADAVAKMGRMIAYSVLDEGNRPFGDTGVRALFDDASDLGKLVSAVDASTSITAARQSLSDMFVQFAGQLAVGAVMNAEQATATDGILTKDVASGNLVVNLSTSRWSVGRGTLGAPTDIAGRSRFIDSVLGGAAQTPSASATRPGMTWLWETSNYSNVGRIVMATTEASRQTDLEVLLPSLGPADLGGQITAYAGSGGNDTITGTAGDDVIYGGDGTNVIDGRGGNDMLVGGAGKDDFTIGDAARHTYVVGGGGKEDVVFYRKSTAFKGEVSTVANGSDSLNVLSFREEGGAELQTTGIEKIVLTGGNDTLRVVGMIRSGDSSLTGGRISIDAGSGDKDLLDLSKCSTGTSIGIGFVNNQLGRSLEEAISNGVKFTGFEKLIGTGKKDFFINVKGVNSIDGGGGKDEFRNIGSGTQVTTGSGADAVYLSNNILVTDASAEDNLYAYDGLKLTGGISREGSEDAWAHGAGRMCKYGYNAKGELVVGDLLGNLTYVANGQSTNYGSDPASRAFGLYIAKMDIQVKLFRELETPWNVDASYAAILGTKPKAELGISLYQGVDPLVLDLDGDGIDLVGQSSVSPRFDLDGDGFSEKAGWVGSGDGLLALDRNGNGVIDDVSELFGGPRADGGVDTNGDGRITGAERMQSGFDALAAYDGNGDGVIDASDAVFSELRVWIDADGDAVTDEGELKTRRRFRHRLDSRSYRPNGRGTPRLGGYGRAPNFDHRNVPTAASSCLTLRFQGGGIREVTATVCA